MRAEEEFARRAVEEEKQPGRISCRLTLLQSFMNFVAFSPVSLVCIFARRLRAQQEAEEKRTSFIHPSMDL